MNTDQIAAEAAAKIHSALLHNVTDEQVEFIQAIIKTAVEKAVKDEVWNHEQTAKLLRKKVEEFQKSRAAHASDSSKCSQCGTELQAGSLTAVAHASERKQ